MCESPSTLRLPFEAKTNETGSRSPTSSEFLGGGVNACCSVEDNCCGGRVVDMDSVEGRLIADGVDL